MIRQLLPIALDHESPRYAERLDPAQLVAFRAAAFAAGPFAGGMFPPDMLLGAMLPGCG